MSFRNLDEDKLADIVSQVVQRIAPALGGLPGGGLGPVTMPNATPSSGSACGPTPPLVARRTKASTGQRGIFDDVDGAVAAARVAHEELVHNRTMEERKRYIEAFRQSGRDHLEEFCVSAVKETGIGRVDDKRAKNTLVLEKTPGPEILQTYCETGDNGLMITERAPFGVIGAITPTTNATETIICNGIGMIAGGNAVVFNVHPSAKHICRRTVELANEYMVRAGAPDNLMCMVADPTIESANTLMTHPGIRLVVVTGGPGVVKAAMNSGKRAICGGPGNPPVVVDETADIRVAGKGIIAGHSIDNNIVCIAEKEVFVVADVADMLKREMIQAGALELTAAEIRKLEKIVVADDGIHANKDFVGKDAAVIAKAIGKTIPAATRTLLCEVDSEEHAFVQAELLMPVLPLVRVSDVNAGIEASVRAEHGFGHTAAMYSTNIDSLHRMARAMDVSIFVKNAPTLAGLGFGGEGWTSFTIASPTGEGLTNATHFTRERRCTLKDHFRII
ncbi:MAG: aldehyde dehydrogenase EutE [Deltaproteobacteria bacterium]|nr:aldehyde dehydrogenase EutE [Deltaproteobacteria bacterium]